MGEIFIRLLNMSITASWLILAVLCIRLLFRKIPQWVTCLLWGIVAIRLIFPFSIESEFSLQPSAEPIKSSAMVEGEVVPYVPSIDSNLGIVENAVNPVLAQTFAYQESESVAPLQVVTGIAGTIWLCGMVALLIFAVVSVIRLRLCVREAVLYKENIYICDAVRSPFILGIVKPRIYLSSALNEEEVDYIIAHEKAHLRRKDHLWKPFGYLLLCVYWFNPLCWIAYIMLCKDIELACDEKVIKDMSFGDKKAYSRVLLSCASRRRLVLVCPLAFGEVGVKERVKSVLNYKRPAFWITMIAVVVCVIVAICFLTNPSKEYQIRVTIPAGSTEEIIYQEDFFYSDEEISPTGNQIIISLGEGMGDTEVVLKPIEVKEENAYEPTYITPGMPVKMDVEKGAWFKIGVNMQNPTTEDIDVYVSVRNVEIRIASEENTESENNIYGNVIAGLGDNNAYAFLDMDYDYMVLLVSDLIYDEGTEKQATIYCDIYYPVGGEAKKLGTIMSAGTAYPITFTKDGIFAASGHKIEKYAISEEGALYLEKGIYEQVDETGNVMYTCMIGGQESGSTVQEYQAMIAECDRSQIVHFSYGAEGSVNEYLEMETALDVKELAIDMEDMQRELEHAVSSVELEHVVRSVGLENAYPWNNTVDFKSNADALIKMASDESGRFEIYGIMSAKYGTYGLLLNDWIDGEQNWNFAYVPWVYTGAPSEQPILEPDENGKYVFAYIYQYDDVPLWQEYILDCGYDTGHMELILQEEAIEDSAIREDYYEVATSISASEVEKFALGIKEDILSRDWASLSEKIAYPISINGFTLNESSDFKELDFDGKLSQEFINAISSESCREMFCNWQGIMMGPTGQIWFAGVDEGSGTWELKIIGINGMFDVSEEIATPVAGATVVDASKIASIVITNGNTGEQKMLTGEEAYSEEYYFYNDLLKLYGQLDFTAQTVENERVGYQYSMVLQDADGNKLQRVTPYKDGLTVDGVFYQYDGTGEGSKASLNLMEYMEYIFYPEQSSMTTPFTEVAVNTLPNVTMTMEDYKAYEGELIISNQTGNDLKTWEWYDMQIWENGAWHRLEQLTDGLWTDVLYQIPAGESTVFPTNWKTWYGELSSGKYRIVKEIFETTADEIDTYYLAVEFEIN